MNEYNIVLAFGAILNPTMKLETLEYYYENLTWELKLEKMKEKLHNLFYEYCSKNETSFMISIVICQHHPQHLQSS